MNESGVGGGEGEQSRKQRGTLFQALCFVSIVLFRGLSSGTPWDCWTVMEFVHMSEYEFGMLCLDCHSCSEAFPGYLLVLTFTRRHGQGNEGSCRTRTEGDEGEGHEGQGEGHEGKEVKQPLSRVQSTCCVQRTPVVLARTGDASFVS